MQTYSETRARRVVVQRVPVSVHDVSKTVVDRVGRVSSREQTRGLPFPSKGGTGKRRDTRFDEISFFRVHGPSGRRVLHARVSKKNNLTSAGRVADVLHGRAAHDEPKDGHADETHANHGETDHERLQEGA